MAEHRSGWFTYERAQAVGDGYVRVIYSECRLLVDVDYERFCARPQAVTTHSDARCRAGQRLDAIHDLAGGHLVGWVDGAQIMDISY